MNPGPLDHAPPDGAERWFYVPRNPAMPSPTNDEVNAAPTGPGGDGVTAYRVPAMAHMLLLMERVASGAKDRGWAPPWRYEDYQFNFAPGQELR